MESVIVGEFSQEKEVDPIILLVANGTPEVLFKDLVDPLSLSISLWMVCRGQVQRSSTDLKKLFPEMGDELRSPIGGDIFWYAV
jgi:hypothetical protein